MALIVLAAAASFTVSPFIASRKCARGERLLASGSAEEAVRSFRSALSLNGRSVDARRGLARALVGQHENSRDRKDLEEAAEYQKQAIERDVQNGMLYGELGEILLRQGRFEDALRQFDEAVRLKAPDKRFERMFVLLRGGVEK
jgi:cytochrome c-type biogenesis protein CcmH/NrfG